MPKHEKNIGDFKDLANALKNNEIQVAPEPPDDTEELARQGLRRIHSIDGNSRVVPMTKYDQTKAWEKEIGDRYQERLKNEKKSGYDARGNEVHGGEQIVPNPEDNLIEAGESTVPAIEGDKVTSVEEVAPYVEDIVDDEVVNKDKKPANDSQVAPTKRPFKDEDMVEEVEDPVFSNWGFSIDEDDPVHGFSEDPDIIREFQKREEEKQKKKERDQEKAAKREAEFHNDLTYSKNAEINEEANESINDEVIRQEKKVNKTEANKEVAAETEEEVEAVHEVDLDQERRVAKLKEIYKDSQEMRSRLKDPGKVSYRVMSVGGVELEKIDQPDNPEERVQKNNDAIKTAMIEAYGDDELDEHAEATIAAAQLYFSEGLIGDDADSVFIGTTETLVSGNKDGQVGLDPSKYKNLVVIRWTNNNINHVIAVSPKEDAALYALVDDSMGNSWREKYIEAGAFDGKARDSLITVNHELKVDHNGEEETHYQQKTFEKLAIKMIDAETEMLASSDMDVKEKADLLRRLSLQMDRLTDSYEYVSNRQKPQDEPEK